MIKNRTRLAREFLRFGAVGVLGFLVDSAILYLFLFGFGLHAMGSAGYALARLPSFFAAASFTWLLNRKFTFADVSVGPKRKQWAKFLAANAIGGVVNYGIYLFCIVLGAPFTQWPFLAVAAGALTGMSFNFAASKAFVFRG